MKHLIALLLPLALLVPLFAFAEDNITVSVNGKTYQCSGSGESHDRYRYRCGCEQWGGSSYYGAYYKVDRETGNQERLKWIDDAGTKSATAQECAEKLRAYAICER